MAARFVVLGCLMLTGCEQVLYTRLSEPEVNEMIAVLAEAGLPASRARGEENTWQLQVQSGQFAVAVQVLREHGLPPPRFANTGDVFKKEGLVSTPSEERIRFKFAQEQELQNTLTHIDGVISARVHIVVPHNDPLADKVKPSSASVFIKHRRDVEMTALVPQIKELVARSVEGLTHDSVALTLFASQGVVRREPPRSPMADAWPIWVAGGALLLVLAVVGWLTRARWRVPGAAGRRAGAPLRPTAAARSSPRTQPPVGQSASSAE